VYAASGASSEKSSRKKSTLRRAVRKENRAAFRFLTMERIAREKMSRYVFMELYSCILVRL
jgi:c-di-GMP-binding flagellar brake protein YcgR